MNSGPALRDGIDLQDTKKHPKMVHWFSPSVLRDAARRAVLSAVFGSYADRRLIQAALNPLDDKALGSQSDFSEKITPQPDGSVWVDCVADLGDGFDSTYAIAYLLGQKSLELASNLVLPRGQVLVMGGDEVYPTPTKDEYANRLKTPYGYAFPNSNAEGADHPPVFLIPGNHDWYDGLTLFLALFCRGRATALGSWRAYQSRSYFAIRLPGNWWIWGIDTQLGEDIDKPQADYFVLVARQMSEDPKLILCSSVPTWVKADIKARNPEERDKFQRGLNYIALDILARNCRSARICAVLSGDLHHYSRYSATETGTQFVTAGGGGAFLHPTHHLQNEIQATWLREPQTLSLTTAPEDGRKACEQEACFPPKEESRRLALGNFSFAWKNWEFSLFLGIVYAIFSMFLMMWQDDVLRHRQESGLSWSIQILCSVVGSPTFLVLAILFGGALCVYADQPSGIRKIGVGALHGLAHVAVILIMVCTLPVVITALPWVHPGNIPYFLIYNVAMIVVGGFLGGVIWGIYLVIASYRRGRHYNDAFSALRLDTYKNFLRMRIKGDTLTIYPIGLKKVPSRGDWQVDEKASLGNQNEPRVVPRHGLDPIIIEGPIVIDATKVMRVDSVSKTAVQGLK